MKNTVIGAGAQITKAIIAEDSEVGERVVMGVGEFAPSKLSEKIYAFDLVTVGERTYIPADVTIGKNVAISGVTTPEDYPDGKLESGDYIVKAGADK